MHPEVRRYYDEAFDRVNNQGVAGVATRFFHKAVERALPPAMHFSTVLELGAAHGEHVTFVRHGFDRYILSDLEDHAIDLRSLSDRILTGSGQRQLSFQVADAEDLPFDDESIDRTVHTCLLHHLRDPEQALREMRRVLRPSGIASIYLPCDPGVLYGVTQRLTTGRKINAVLRAGHYKITADYLRSQEHPNHYRALRAMVEEVFKGDALVHRGFPLSHGPVDANYFSVFQVRVVK